MSSHIIVLTCSLSINHFITMALTITRTKALLFSFLLLTGCSSHINNSNPSMDSADSFYDSSIDGENENPLDGSDHYLTLELDDLRATGDWKNKEDQSIAPQPAENGYDFPIVLTPQVEMYLKLFQGKQHRQFALWLEQSGKYIPMMHAELAKAGIPLDLAYLAMIESGYDLKAYSHASAVGLWQFMKGTGRAYNLDVNAYVDERCDALKSTKAAAAYLSYLHDMFDDWYLAVAAYNAGPGKVRNGLKRYKVDNFWDLADKKYLQLETKRYVPKLIATILIAKNPAKYGFTSLQYQAPLQYDTITVGPGLSLDAIATISNSDRETISMLNTEIKGNKTPKNQAKYQAKIPYGTLQLAQTNLPRLHSMFSTGYKTHIVRKGESFSSICRKYNINKPTLMKVNKLKIAQAKKGKRLRIPYSTISYHLLPEGTSDKMVAYKDSLILHKIKRGETISQIARKYGVPAALIVSWNELPSVNKIRTGQQLALYIEKRGSGSKNNRKQIIARQNGKTYPTLHANKKLKHKRRDSKTSWYMVQNGDSIWTISRKFNISPNIIKQINNLTSNLIHPGNKLKIVKG